MMTWGEYTANRRIFDHLSTIRRFSLVLDTPPIPEIGKSENAAQIATRLYGPVRQAVDSSSFYSFDELSLSSSPGAAGVSYEDDRFDFSLTVQDGHVALQRQGSNFEDFHTFYARLSDHLPELMKGALREIAEYTRRDCELLRGAYIFEFLIFNIRTNEATHRRLKNSEIMNKIITGVPGDDGKLVKDENLLEKLLADAGRLDTNVSRWVDAAHAGGMRLERYELEAPTNKDRLGLWARFSYAGDTYTVPASGDLDRIKFSGENFFEEHEDAYVSFLRNTAIEGFLGSLLHGYTFQSSASTLP